MDDEQWGLFSELEGAGSPFGGDIVVLEIEAVGFECVYCFRPPLKLVVLDISQEHDDCRVIVNHLLLAEFAKC